MPGIALRRGTSKSAPRRAVARWAWRMFRREWRQQVLVLCLLGIAVAATTFGVALATNGVPRGQTTVTLTAWRAVGRQRQDRKSTRLNSSHLGISYAVFCLKKKKNKR